LIAFAHFCFQRSIRFTLTGLVDLFLERLSYALLDFNNCVNYKAASVAIDDLSNNELGSRLLILGVSRGQL